MPKPVLNVMPRAGNDLASGSLKRAIVIGASSGIGYELAKVLSAQGYVVGLAARRLELLEELQKEMIGPSFIRQIDVAEPEEVFEGIGALVAELGGLDLCVINAGVGFMAPEFNWEKDAETIAVNVTGFCAAATCVMRLFVEKGAGHLVGMSSIAGLRGGAEAPVYHASKAFVSNYMEGLRQKVGRLGLPITITDIRPGFVDTALIRGSRGFWVASAEMAARQIYRDIERKRAVAYVTRRWRVVGWLLRAVPSFIYCRM